MTNKDLIKRIKEIQKRLFQIRSTPGTIAEETVDIERTLQSELSTLSIQYNERF